MSLENTAREAFKEHFGAEPTLIVRAPGRVNLIGEHTDYNDGFVMPMAIDRAVCIALRPRDDEYMFVYSLDYGGHAEMSLTEMTYRHSEWAEYMKGVAWAMQEAGYALKGWEGVVTGDVPRGAGLSSSAAIELATARALAHVSGIEWHPAKMALLCQKAENLWVKVNSGIMDQMISASGQEGYALLIDCRTLETTPAPLPAGLSVVILDTMTRRGLVDSKYNERRAECERAAAHFGVKALRDVTLDQLIAAKDQLDPVVYKRAHHIITENARVLDALDAMRVNDIPRLGKNLNDSHDSLRDDFEVTQIEGQIDALDVMVQCARAHAGCVGARMTGGGFGGCAVAIVRSDAVESFTQQVSADYQAKMNLTPQVYVTTPQAGARIVYQA